MDANINIGLNVNASGAERSVGSLKAQLRAAQAEVAALSEQFGATSVEAANAARKAAEIADAIGDAKRLTDAFNPDAKFTALTRSIGGALNGFQAFQGAIGIMGVESEDLQKTLLKVQSAMALSQGLQGIMEAKDDFIILGSVIKNTVVGAFTTLRGAIISTGIGALVVVVGLLVNEFMKMSEAENQAAEKKKKLNELIKKGNEEMAKESSHFLSLVSQLKATNKGSDERKRLIGEINKQYGTTIQNLKDEKKFQEQLNGEVKNYLEYQKEKFALKYAEAAQEKVYIKQREIQSDIYKNQQELEDLNIRIAKNEGGRNAQQKAFFQDRKKYLEENIQKGKEDLDTQIKRFDELGAAALKHSKKMFELSDGEKKYGDAVASTTTKEEEALSLQEEIDDERIRAMDDGQAKEEAIARLAAQRKIDAAKKEKYSAQELADYEVAVKDALAVELRNIDKKYWEDIQLNALSYKEGQDVEKEQELESSKSHLDALSDLYNDFFDKKNKKAEEDLKKEQDRRMKNAQMASDAFAVLSDITSLFHAKNEADARRQFKIQKAFNLSAAIINTGMAVTAALTGGGNVAKIATSENFVEAALAAAIGGVNIAKIAAQQFQGGGGGGGDMGGGGGGGNRTSNFSAPSFTPTQFTNLGKTNTNTGAGKTNNKVYVLENDITKVQNKVSVIESRSVLGG